MADVLRFLSDHIPIEVGKTPGDPLSIQYIFKFPNEYGARVSRGKNSYGGPQGFWEVAVLNKKGKITYSTKITDDVLGFLNDVQVSEVLYEISDL